MFVNFSAEPRKARKSRIMYFKCWGKSSNTKDILSVIVSEEEMFSKNNWKNSFLVDIAFKEYPRERFKLKLKDVNQKHTNVWEYKPTGKAKDTVKFRMPDRRMVVNMNVTYSPSKMKRQMY